jgi:hypothetical protein
VLDLLAAHVLEVAGHEQPELGVQRGGHRCAAVARRAAQGADGAGEPCDLALVLVVLVRQRGGRAGRPRLDGGVDELVLVLHVAGAEVQQLHHALGGVGDLELVVGVHAAEGDQGLGHAGAQRLVDAGVQVEPRRLRRGQLLHFAGVDLHGVSFG